MALATCSALPDLDLDDRPLVPPLAQRGIEAVPAVWDDPAIAWTTYDLVVLRSTWDYAERLAEFTAWVERLPRVLNPTEVVRWNTDKGRYLSDLGRAAVPVVPTRVLEPGAPIDLPTPPLVVKPAVSAGGRSSGRFEGDGLEAARTLVRRIHSEGRTALVQPFLAEAEAKGETALVYVAGAYSHTVARRVPLPLPGEPPAAFYLEEEVGPRDPTAAERGVAEAAVAATPRAADLLYARVDLVDGAAGPVVLELELTEPSLYLAYGRGAVDRLADAIAAAV